MKNDSVFVFFWHGKMFTIDYKVEVSCKTMCEIPRFYFSDYIYVYKNLEGYAKMSTVVSYGQQGNRWFLFYFRLPVFSKKNFFCIMMPVLF